HLHQSFATRKIQLLNRKAWHEKYVSKNSEMFDRRRGRVMVKVFNLLKKGLLVRRRAMEASKRRRSKLDYIIQQLSKGSIEGSSIIPKVLDEPKDNSEVAEKQARNIQTSLTLSSAELEIKSMMDVPVYQEDPTVQRTPLIDDVFSMVTEKTTSTPTSPTTQAQVQMCSTSC
nr:hypothetical protein [Tanacetum cinerariifolium]